MPASVPLPSRVELSITRDEHTASFAKELELRLIAHGCKIADDATTVIVCATPTLVDAVRESKDARVRRIFIVPPGYQTTRPTEISVKDWIDGAGNVRVAARSVRDRVRAFDFDIFISYAHADGSRVAEALQRRLERFALPFFAGRSVRVFRDSSTVAATSDLDDTILQAVDRSRFFVLVATPTSRRNHWPKRETTRYIETHGTATVALVLGNGKLPWTDRQEDWDHDDTWVDDDCAIDRATFDALSDHGRKEPIVVDLRNMETGLSRAELDARVASVAAAVTNRDKDELYGAHLSRRRKQLGMLLGLSLLVLAASGIAVWFALKREEASRQAQTNAEQAALKGEEARRNAELAERRAVELRDRARALEAASWTRFASIARDPFVGAQILAELPSEHVTPAARRAARKIAAQNLPITILRHNRAIVALEFESEETLVVADDAGVVWRWRADGVGDPEQLYRLPEHTRVHRLMIRGDTIGIVGPEERLTVVGGSDRRTVGFEDSTAPPESDDAFLWWADDAMQWHMGRDGRWIAKSRMDGTLAVWDGSTPGDPHVLELGTVVLGMLPTPTPNVALATMLGSDGSLWELARGEEGFSARRQCRLITQGTLRVPRVETQDPFADAFVVMNDRDIPKLIRGSPRCDQPLRSYVLAPDEELAALALSRRATTVIVTTSEGRTLVLDERMLPQAPEFEDTKIFEFDAATFDPGDDDGLEPLVTKSVAVSPDGASLVLTHQRRATRWIVGSNRPPLQFTPGYFFQTSIPPAVSPDGRLYALAEQTTEIRVFSGRDGRSPRTVRLPARAFEAKVSTSLELAAMADAEGRVWTWGLDTAVAPRILTSGPEEVPGIDLSADERRLAVAFSDARLEVWDLKTLEQEMTSTVQGVSSEDEHLEVSYLGATRELLVLDAEGRLLLLEQEGHGESTVLSENVDEVAVAKAVPRAAYLAQENRVARLSGKNVVELEVPGEPAKFVRIGIADQSGLIAAGTSDGRLVLWPEGAPARELALFHADDDESADITSIAVAPDGSVVVAGAMSGRAFLVPVAGGAPMALRAPDLATYAGALAHQALVYESRFSPDGTHVVTCGGMDSVCRVWNRQELGAPERFQLQNIATAIAFTGSDFFVLDESGGARLWPLDWQAVIRDITKRTNAQLLPDQRHRYLGEPMDEARAIYERLARARGRTPVGSDYFSVDYEP